ncbi:SRPBCC family protein [Ilumatobacter sp.]|uniref:SRPBCC family protein n=1 Tax=Ilumatobacter sp. TaxID=1967498 RepID=UPI003B52EFFF
MPESTVQSGVAVPADALFDYLSKVSNLPEYFPKMTSAESVDSGEAVRTTAELDDGRTVEGEAWFRTDQATRSVEWGSEGDDDYHGSLRVESDGATASTVEITIHTEREGAGDDLEGSLREVLDRIKEILESSST